MVRSRLRSFLLAIIWTLNLGPIVRQGPNKLVINSVTALRGKVMSTVLEFM